MSANAVFLVAIAMWATMGVGRSERTLTEPEHGAQASPQNNAAVEIEDYDEILEHHVRAHRPVRMVLAGRDEIGFFTGVQLKLVVDTSGNVVSVAATEGPERVVAAAIAEAKNWKYKPFEKDGQP